MPYGPSAVGHPTMQMASRKSRTADEGGDSQERPISDLDPPFCRGLRSSLLSSSGRTPRSAGRGMSATDAPATEH